ncbi:ACP synthase, partial [Staphylococcus xylosus]
VVPSLAQNISTNIIFIGNNTDPHKLRQTVLRQSITHKNISFGFLMTGGNRGDSATTVIRFNAGELKVSHLNGVIPFHNKLDAIFKNSSIKLTYETRFEDWLMSHAAMIIPLNAGISLKNKYKDNQKQLLSNMIKSYNELHSLIEHSNYNIVPKLQSTLFKNFKWLAYPLLKLIINIKIMNQIQGSNSEVNALYKDIKLLNKQTALTTNYLDEMIIELRS